MVTKAKELGISKNEYINLLIEESISNVLQKNHNIEVLSRINHLVNVVDKQTIELNKLSQANEIIVNLLGDIFDINEKGRN
ncbi:hypothetical protein J2Z59_001636 [Jeotgalicoccus pinnipedialis]|uniref:hypothetical protein n=1 Tax=Phocicoccus pinnipedialis TaxID=110845 RepID=UPI001FDB032A|nr:hypothetical protein [Jeotgalicoccus pinnipedialis]